MKTRTLSVIPLVALISIVLATSLMAGPDWSGQVDEAIGIAKAEKKHVLVLVSISSAIGQEKVIEKNVFSKPEF